MRHKLASRCARLRLSYVFLLVAIPPPSTSLFPAISSDWHVGEIRTDALTFLKLVGQRYANATSYRIEATTEEQINAEFSRDWSKSVTTAIVALGNRYHFEVHSRWEWWVLISDGQTE